MARMFANIKSKISLGDFILIGCTFACMCTPYPKVASAKIARVEKTIVRVSEAALEIKESSI